MTPTRPEPTVDAAQRAARARIDADEAALLLAHVLQRSRSWLYAHGDAVLAPDQQRRFAAAVERRAAGEPVAYITGARGFWTFDLQVTPHTLIPRADTERLVELALARIPVDAAWRVADLGTGSGAIALAIARERPRARVIATDRSVAALAVAHANAARLGVANVSFQEGDWLDALRSTASGADEANAFGAGGLHVIVSNPPYIASDDPHLRRGDLRFEPASALASGVDGLDDIRRIVAGAGAHLVVGGWLLLEHGWHQGAAVRALLQRAGFADVATAQDIEGRDRVSLGRHL